MDKITQIHDKVLDFLITYRRQDPTLYFIPRRKNNWGRLDKGYWFIGNERYLQITFWESPVGQEKVHSIGFNILVDKTSYVEFTPHDDPNRVKHFEQIASVLGFTKSPNKDKWFRKYEGTDYLTHLKDFIEHEKAYIDNYINHNWPMNVYFIKSWEFHKYMDRIFKERNKLTQLELSEEEPAGVEELFEGNRKNTDKRRKRVQTDSVYDPYHDKIQNALFECLKNSTDEYSFVQIERERVDLKALVHTGEWHYFEIKTDSPKLSIRKALGQVMEYAYFPDIHRATRLYVVADLPPSDDVIRYLHFIRTNFDIPVYYRYFLLDIGFLSGEY